MNTTDMTLLVRAAQQNDREAMTLIYERTSPQIWRAIRSMVQEEELAKDVQQETYLKAFAALSQLQEPEKLLPWLRAIAVNEAKTALEQEAPLRFSELTVPELTETQSAEDPEGMPELALEAKERADLVNRVLSVLPDGQRLIVGMYYYEQLSTKEIAETLGISSSTVKSQLHRGRKTIEQRLSQLRKDGARLFGLGFFLRFLKTWRKQPTGEALRPILQAAPKPAAELAYTSAKAVAASRIAAAAAAVCLLGGTVFGTALLREHQEDLLREGRPSKEVVMETIPVEQTKDRPKETSVEPTEGPAEPTEEAAEPETAEETEAVLETKTPSTVTISNTWETSPAYAVAVPEAEEASPASDSSEESLSGPMSSTQSAYTPQVSPYSSYSSGSGSTKPSGYYAPQYPADPSPGFPTINLYDPNDTWHYASP